jgi:hypothetical protein
VEDLQGTPPARRGIRAGLPHDDGRFAERRERPEEGKPVSEKPDKSEEAVSGAGEAGPGTGGKPKSLKEAVAESKLDPELLGHMLAHLPKGTLKSLGLSVPGEPAPDDPFANLQALQRPELLRICRERYDLWRELLPADAGKRIAAVMARAAQIGVAAEMAENLQVLLRRACPRLLRATVRIGGKTCLVSEFLQSLAPAPGEGEPPR